MKICSICKEEFEDSDIYEYRGAYACSEHFEEAQGKRNFERAEVMEELDHKTKFSKGLNFGDNVIGRANRKLLKPQIEITKKESMRVRNYERPT